MSVSDLEFYIKKLGVKNFKGVFMRDTLPKSKPNKVECGIINLDSIHSTGTHWTCYMKKGNVVVYFDSYGNATPPLELQKYLKGFDINYTTDDIQTYSDPPICGHLCLEVIRLFSKGVVLDKISLIIKNNKYGFLSWF